MLSFRYYLNEKDNEKMAGGALFYAQDTGKYGLGLRSKICDSPHTYGPIGGSADDKDENMFETIIREVGEEIGCAIKKEQLTPLYVDKKPNFQYHTYLCTVPKQNDIQPKLNDENDEFTWFSKNEMPDNLHPGFAKLMQLKKDDLP